MMLSEICAELRNYFVVPDGVHRGTFKIKDGMIAPLDFLQEGQYFRIVGSVFNDGVYQYPANDLTDETFDGAVWALAVPHEVVKLAEEIEAYTKTEAAKPSPFVSESFGGYTYQKASDKGGSNSWQSVFSKRLNRYRRISL
jgi:hypothetical protein